MKVLKLNEIEKLYSNAVAALIMKGYVIHSEHSRGSQSREVSTITLTNDNGKTFIRVGLLDDYECIEELRRVRVLKLVVLKFDTETYKWSTLWNSEGEVLSEKVFFEVSDDAKVYCESEEELAEVHKIRRERRNSYEYLWDNKRELSEKVADIAWRIIRNRKGYKDIPRRIVKKVVRYKNSYVVEVEGKSNYRFDLAK